MTHCTTLRLTFPVVWTSVHTKKPYVWIKIHTTHGDRSAIGAPPFLSGCQIHFVITAVEKCRTCGMPKDPQVNNEPAKQRLSFLPLLGIIFFSTSGGPFGMEDIAAGGPGLALLLLVVTPLVWSMPIALVAA